MLQWRYISACLIGNVLEWYDFILYGIFAGTFSVLFFSQHNAHAALLATFAVLAVGYLSRPLGGVIFGHIGDKYSRRKALIISLSLMGLLTAAIGLLPTYAVIGVFAPLLLVILRILQGLIVGGEFAGAMTILAEQAPPRWKGFVSTFAMVGAMGGVLLATIVANLVLHTVSKSTLLDYAWRLPFLLGIILALLGIYLRCILWRHIHFKAHKHVPWLVLVKQCKGSLLAAMGYLTFPAVYTGIVTVFLVPYFSHYLHYSMRTAVTLELLTSVTTMLTLPLAGLFSDLCGNYKMYLRVSLAIVILFALPVFVFSIHYPKLGLILFCILCSAAMGPEVVLLARFFPKQARYSGLGLSHGLTFSIITGFTPLFLTYLIPYLGVIVPGVLLTFSVVIAWVVMMLTQCDKHQL